MKENILVSYFPKNSLEEVRAQITNYKGHDLIDVRVWVKRKDGQGDLATAKGLTLNIDLMPQLKEAVLALEQAVKTYKEENQE